MYKWVNVTRIVFYARSLCRWQRKIAANAVKKENWLCPNQKLANCYLLYWQ